MNIFTPYQSPLKTAECLDVRRLNSQIRECKLIINSITGEGPGKGWNKHPVSKMYKDHLEWIKCYLKVLMYYKYSIQSNTPHHIREFEKLAYEYNDVAISLTPPFLTNEFCDQHKRRLYTKKPLYYLQFEQYGKSQENWYVLDNKIVKYINGNVLK